LICVYMNFRDGVLNGQDDHEKLFGKHGMEGQREMCG